MYKISVDRTFTIVVSFSENMKSVNIIFSLLLNFTIYLQSASKPILYHSNSISEIIDDIEHIQYDIKNFNKKNRTKRQYFYGSHLGPISFDSGEYESNTPPPNYESAEKSGDDLYYYSKPDTTTSVQSRVSYIIFTTFL